MGNNQTHLLKYQKGQALILSVFLVMATAMTAVLMYNNGQTTSEKTRLVNAADAAAYSGAVYFARNLNFLAYTNRAMIANHVAIGHFVSYVSWVRYVQDSLSKLDNYSRFVPYIGPAVSYAESVVTWVKEGTETIAPALIAATDALNKKIFEAQKLSQSSMNGVLSVSTLLNVKIMDKVAKTYHPDIRVNYTKDVNATQGGAAALQVIADIKNVLQYVKFYTASNDEGRMKTMIESSYDISAPWILGDRGWDINLFVAKLNKDGSTKHVLEDGLMDWQASDALIYKWRKLRRWKTGIVASGEASATEFDSNYAGVSGYYDLRNRDNTSEQILNISALATLPISSTRFMELMGLRPGAQRLAALSRAEIFHKRPHDGFDYLGKGEYANLYNPFWQVRLSKNQI